MDKKMNPFAKFGIWMVVIIIMVTVSFIKGNNENHWFEEDYQKESSYEASKENNNPKEDNKITYPVMQEMLGDNNFEYVFTIENDSKVKYTGRRCNGLETGFKETKDGIIKYIIDSDKKTYKYVDDEKVEVDDLFAGFDANFLDVKLLFNNLSDILYTKEENTYKYEKEGHQVGVTTNDEYITKITIANANTTYILEFANIGKCAKIDFNN